MCRDEVPLEWVRTEEAAGLVGKQSHYGRHLRFGSRPYLFPSAMLKIRHVVSAGFGMPGIQMLLLHLSILGSGDFVFALACYDHMV